MCREISPPHKRSSPRSSRSRPSPGAPSAIPTLSATLPGPDTGTRNVYAADTLPVPLLCLTDVHFALARRTTTIQQYWNTASAVTHLTDHNALRVAYSKTLAGYVVDEGGNCWLLNSQQQNGRGKSLPSAPLSFYTDVDAGSALVKVSDDQLDLTQQQTAGAGKFWDTFAETAGDGKYLRGTFITINPPLLPAFLGMLGQKGGTLSQEAGYARYPFYMLRIKGLGN